MKSKKWLALLLTMMLMSTTAAYAIGTPTDTCTHPSFHWVSTGYETHTEECDVCGWQSFANGLHYRACTQEESDKTCAQCGAEYTGDRTRHFLKEGQKFDYGYDDEMHWNVCPICHQATGDDGDWHANENGDPSGICAVCGAPYGEAASEPTATPTTKPAEPTAKPAEPTAEPATPTAEPADAPDEALETEQADEDFLTRFQGLSSFAAAGTVLSGEGADVVTLVMEATEEQGYEGSELTLYPAGSRDDGVIISLTSRFDAESIGGFAAWQESVTSAEALKATEAYGSFVELARALVKSLFPEKAEDEVDECLVALLQSAFDGTLESADLAPFGEDVDGEIIGCLAAEDYVICLIQHEGSVALLVRDAA